jgi:basic membrane protein A
MRPWKVFALFVTLGMVVALVDAVPAAASHGDAGKVCIVNSIGGPDDPFNRDTAEGAKDTEAKLKVGVEILDAFTEAEIVTNIDSFLTAGDCDLIIGIGFISGGLLEPAIVANPDQRFALIDFGFGGLYPNVAEVVFRVDQAGFLAGYVAAGLSTTGKVGVFGGWPLPPVTAFMDGYALGVAWYNSVSGTAVEVLGWDPDTQIGLFTFDFQDPAAGKAVAASLYYQGADTVFPVAGLTSYGAWFEATERKAAGDDVRVIGVDYDWADVFGDPDRVILTSVIKDSGPAVFNQIAALVDGSWSPGFVFVDLEDGATDIAPFHYPNSAVPGFVKNNLKDLRTGIIDGTIPAYP